MSNLEAKSAELSEKLNTFLLYYMQGDVYVTGLNIIVCSPTLDGPWRDVLIHVQTDEQYQASEASDACVNLLINSLIYSVRTDNFMTIIILLFVYESLTTEGQIKFCIPSLSMS